MRSNSVRCRVIRLPSVRGVARNLFAEFDARMAEHFLVGGKPRRQQFLHGVAARDDDRRRAVRRSRAPNSVIFELRETSESVMRVPACSSLVGHFAAAQIQIEDERLARCLQRAVDLLGAGGNPIGDPARRVDDRDFGKRLLRAPNHLVGEFLRTADHLIGQLLRARQPSCRRWQGIFPKNPR